jgi:hypothetical protein
VAGDRARGLAGHRLPVLGGAERAAARLPVDQPGRDLRRDPLDRRVGRLRVLRVQLRLLQQDLREPVGGHRLSRLVVGHQRGDPLGPR